MSCSSSSDDDFMEDVAVIVDDVVDDETQTSSFKGDFVSAAHPTSGMVSISTENTELTFKNFKTDAGPKLLVYLTNDLNASEFVNLGDLKGIEGDYSYTIPEGTDLSKFKYVNIWCVDFSVGFGHAELKIE